MVQPVLAALYQEGEVRDATVRVNGRRLIVTITTVDECDDYDIAPVDSGPIDAKATAYDMADRIEEYISETSFAWGQQRLMHGPIPGPLRDE